jgi:hypothetical protein
MSVYEHSLKPFKMLHTAKETRNRVLAADSVAHFFFHPGIPFKAGVAGAIAAYKLSNTRLPQETVELTCRKLYREQGEALNMLSRWRTETDVHAILMELRSHKLGMAIGDEEPNSTPHEYPVRSVKRLPREVQAHHKAAELERDGAFHHPGASLAVGELKRNIMRYLDGFEGDRSRRGVAQSLRRMLVHVDDAAFASAVYEGFIHNWK